MRAINNSQNVAPSAVLGGSGTIGFPASRISWISLALLCTSAAYFLNDMRKQTLETPQMRLAPERRQSRAPVTERYKLEHAWNLTLIKVILWTTGGVEPETQLH